MKMISHKTIFTAFTVMLMIAVVPIQSHALTLSEAREEALRVNLNIKISQEKSYEAVFFSKESYTKLLPVLSLNGESTYSNKETGVIIDRGIYGTYPFGQIPDDDVKIISQDNVINFYGNVRLQQPVFAGGRIYFSYKGAQSKADEAQWDEKQTVQDTLFNIEKAYFDLLKAIAVKKFTDQHKDTLTVHLNDMEKMYKNGRIAYVDVLKVKVQDVEAEGEVIKAANDIAIAEGNVNLILNRPLDKPVDAVFLDTPQHVGLSIEEAEEIAMANNKALNSARAKRTTALFERRVAEADYYPSLTISTQYWAQRKEPNFPNSAWSALLNMEWPFWQWGGTKHKVNAKKAYEREAEYLVSSIENDIASQVRNTFLHIGETDQRIIIDKEAIAHAEENLRITQIGFANGRKTSTDVLDAEEELTKTRSLYVKDLYDTFTARSTLRYIMGKMEAENFAGLRLSVNESAIEEKTGF